MLTTVIISILVFGFLIFIHEFGHYITARIFKVSITDFSIGMGPKLVTYESKKNGIKYSLSILPIGGYVAMVGEDGESDDPNAFHKKPAWQRFIITAAGAAVNIIAGFLAMIIIVCFMTIGNTVYDVPRDESEMQEMYEAVDFTGCNTDELFKTGDEIISVNGKKVKLFEELSYEIMRNGTKPLDIVVIRGGEEVELKGVVFPTTDSQGQKFGLIDFYVTDEVDKNIITVVPLAVRKTALVMRMCWESIFDLITGRYSMSAVSGPIGISSEIGKAAKDSFLSLLNITVLISINLGFMNLLPIPALDGGRLVTLLIEMITRKRIPVKVEGIINGVGLALLLLLSVVIMFKDVFTLFS